MSSLQLANVSKTYQSGEHTLKVLDQVTVSFEEGGVYAIVGPSGSGKTTLLNLLSGLDTTYEGSIKVFGKELRQLNLDEYRRRTVSMIFQSFNLVPYLTVFENVALPLKLQGFSKREIVERVTQRLKEVGIYEHRSKTPNKLSGGQQQRVAIARALVMRPKILLADEPTGNLDIDTGETVLELLVELTNKHNTTTIVVTHDEYVINYIPHKYRLYKGKLIKF